MTEHRQHPRFAIELDAEVSVMDDVTVSGRTHDISVGGISMQASAPVPVPALCSVRLSLVFSETEFSEQLTVSAATVWCTPFRGAYQIGLKFGPLDPQNRAYLALFINFLHGGDDDDDDEDEHEETGDDTTE
jgi:PilZ domain-containing protein